jgi:hypothetical protein
LEDVCRCVSLFDQKLDHALLCTLGAIRETGCLHSFTITHIQRVEPTK